MSHAADADTIKMKILATLIIGAAFLGVASCENHQSELSVPDDEPIREQENVKQRQNTPEVVLQLKYDRGELNRIYLTQFRKQKTSWNPSVSVQSNLCADLCHAGLGGDVCGPACDQLLPVGLKSALVDPNSTDVSVAYGQPRVGVCPGLCDNDLGKPLCECSHEAEHAGKENVDWSAVCEAFCADGYALSGCPLCEAMNPTAGPNAASYASQRALNTAEGWQSWCNVQCPQGNGGLACNCDRAPFQ